jgi:hypothetical protein
LRKLAYEKGLPKRGFGKLNKDVYISLLKGNINLTDIIPAKNQSIHELRRLAFNSGLEKIGNGKKVKQFYLDYINENRVKYIIKNGQKLERLQTKNMADGTIKEAQILLDNNEVDILVSWNFKHIVHFDKIRQFNVVNLKMGFKAIAIHSPREVTHYGEEV